VIGNLSDEDISDGSAVDTAVRVAWYRIVVDLENEPVRPLDIDRKLLISILR
jgi:hypothetical protein